MAVHRVLVIGGGITGSTAALAMARRGLDVELLERTLDWRGVGHGITLQGNALRAFQQIRVYDELRANGYPFDQLRMLRADGGVIAVLPTPHTGGDDLPSTMGALRSSLGDILCRAVYAAGVTVRLGHRATRLDQDPDGVTVTFDDGATARYDLVVGADGIRSTTREMIGIETRPAASGMSIWRIGAPRPPELTCADVYYGGPRYKAGYSPVSADACYAYVLDEPLDPGDFGDRSPASILYERSAGYGGLWGRLRETIDETTDVNHQPIEWMLVDDPWYRGRVIVIGDAAHACPPLIAQGAAMCAEDAVVLAELVTADAPIGTILAAFMRRRLPRVRLVVENSMRLVAWEIHPDTPGADPGRVMNSTLDALREPA